MASNIGQVLHLKASHGRLPSGSRKVDVLEPDNPSTFLDIGRQSLVEAGRPSLIIPRHEG